jgi:hypothetical protein
MYAMLLFAEFSAMHRLLGHLQSAHPFSDLPGCVALVGQLVKPFDNAVCKFSLQEHQLETD